MNVWDFAQVTRRHSATSKEYTIPSETGSESNSPPEKRTKINLWPSDHKQRRRSSSIQRSRADLASQTYTWTSQNGKDLSEMEGAYPRYYKSARAFSNFGEVVSVPKGRHKFNRKLRNGKRHVRIFPAGGILQYCRGKFLSSVVPARMSSPRKQWCDAIDAKLTICSVRIAPWLCPLRKDLTCLTLSRARLFRIPPPLGPSKNPELMRRGAMSLLRRGRLVVAPVQGCLPSLTKEMALSGCLLCQMIRHRGWLSLLLQELQLIQMKLTRSQSKVSKLWETLISHASTDNWTEKRLLRTLWRKVNFR